LDDALEPVYQATLRERLDRDLSAILAKGVSEPRIEQALGVSRGYLSRLRSGRRTPSRELVVAIAYMAKDKADPPFAETLFPGDLDRHNEHNADPKPATWVGVIQD
jgi:transcriptional regulator with XRE-family HTH domain